MLASKGAWRLYRHLALFNAIALAVAGGEIRNLIIEIPPQHGKSQFWSRYFPAWYVGTFPEDRVILASYEASYAKSWGRAARDVLEEFGQEFFGVSIRQDTHAADDWSLEGHEGGMTTSGLDGPLTGRKGDLAIIDDPIKGPQEAESKVRKDQIWNWWESTLSSRMSKTGKRIVLMTRWAVDDLIGKILEGATKVGPCQYVTTAGEPWTVIRLPAIADEDEDWPQWRWKRASGEALCPERFPLAELERRRARSDFWWATMYQQLPYAREGGELKASWFQVMKKADLPKLDWECRSWDLASTTEKSAPQTAGVRIGRWGPADDHQYVITDVVSDWWGSGDRDKEIKAVAKTDGKALKVLVEQEPGSGGKVQAESIVRQLDGWPVEIVLAGGGGSKVLRADPLASAAKNKRVWILEGAWNARFLEQIRSFPGGLIDMVDATAQGFNWLSEQADPFVLPAGYNPMDAVPGAGLVFPPSGGRVF